jgi:nucleotide-binding universal stress UspA family protein
MNAKRTIVVGVDGTEAGRRALRWALEEAARIGAEVQAITAWSFEVSAVPGVNDPYTAGRRAAKILADDVAAVAAGDGTAVVQRTVEGPAVEMLVAAATDAALLVVGSHRHGRLFEAILGSVTVGCLRHAACPVVVVPPEHGLPRRHSVAGAVTGQMY